MHEKTSYEDIYLFLKKATQENKDYHLLTFFSEVVNLLKSHFEKMDWVGFYLVDEEHSTLYLGPYRDGVDACENIPKGKGVCGTAYQEEKTQLVNDVHQLTNYIACSSSTQSEIVLPCFHNGKIIAVLDIDSDQQAAFDSEDQEQLERILSLTKEIQR